MLVVVVLDLLGDKSSILNKDKINLNAQLCLLLTLCIESFVKVVEEIDMIMVWVKYLFHLKSRCYHNLSGRDNMNRLSLCVGEHLHKEDSLFQGCFDMRFPSFGPSCELNSKLTFIKSVESEVWIE